ncbi:MAG TPA: glycosyltransferase family 9 protein, partial [Bacteroidota bacterium]|nr:glycosyltransferase family 9 protein [Bacteroidota bacterium]
MEHRRKVSPGKGRTIVLVADLVWGRNCKIGYGLRMNGWHVVLLHKGDLPQDSSCSFDETYRYENPAEALALAFKHKAFLYHVFAHWNFEIAELFIKTRLGKVVLDDYDVLAGVVRESHIKGQYEVTLKSERFCLEHADGICCRDLLVQSAKYAAGYSIAGKVIFFPDYCWDRLAIGASRRSVDRSNLSIVYAGNVSIEKFAAAKNPRDNFYLLEFAHMMADAGIHFHLYPSPLPHFTGGLQSTLSEHLEFSAATPFYHVHEPVSPSVLPRELAQYDIGLLSLWRGMDLTHPAYEKIMFTHSSSNKIFDYLDAGIGVVTCDALVLQRQMLRRYNVGLSAFLEDAAESIRREPAEFWEGLKDRALKARRSLSVVRHAVRLSAFYESIVSEDTRSIFPLCDRQESRERENARVERSAEWGKVLSEKIDENLGELLNSITLQYNTAQDGRLTWSRVRQRKQLKLYAGDVPGRSEYQGWVGLSLANSDERHLQHDITQPLPLPDASVDAFQAEDVFEHIPYDKLGAVVNEIHRVLKPGGYFRLSIPDYGCDVLRDRSKKNAKGDIVFDPGGGGTPEQPGHVWFPRHESVARLLNKSAFGKHGKIRFLHFWAMDGSYVTNEIDYARGFIQRTPDNDKRVQSPYRPMSIVVDLEKAPSSLDPVTLHGKIMSTLPISAAKKEEGPVKISFVIIVLNGMPFLKPCVEAIYDVAHEIIVVEGAVEKCLFAANADGSSNDGSVEFLKSFPDPAKKLHVIQGRWPEKCEMQNKALEVVTGNYVWLVDSDEIYKKRDLLKVKNMLEQDRSITQMNFIPDNFWKGYDYIFFSPLFFQKANHYRRLFKFVEGARFASHRPPRLVWPGSDQSTETMHLIDGVETRRLGIVPYHYSYVLASQVKQKMELYGKYGWGDSWGVDMRQWFEEGFLKWTPENRTLLERQYHPWAGDSSSCTVPFHGEHPEVMKELVGRADRKVRDVKSASIEGQPHEDTKAESTSNAARGKRRLVVASDVVGHHDLTAVHDESQFADAIKEVFSELRPKWVLETGTYLGEGTTRVIAATLHDLGLKSTTFCSIEVNPAHYELALQNLAARNLLGSVKLLRGLSVPRSILPTLEEIEKQCVRDVEYDDIVVDHREQERALLYYKETDFTGAQDDLIGEFLRACDYRPDFVLLDSGGHMGNIEFNYLIDKLQGPCVIALDDIYHIKHHRSFRQIQSDPRFKLLKESHEKFGFCLARFEPGKALPATTKHIVVLRTDSIGDNLLGSSMFPAIKREHPGALITVVCQASAAPLYEHSPFVDDVIPFDRSKAINLEVYREGLLERIRSLGADVLLNTVYSRESLTDLLALKSGVNCTVAFDGDNSNIADELRRKHNTLYSRIIETKRGWNSELERYAEFLAGIGIREEKLQPEYHLADGDSSADDVFREHGLNPETTIALFAGAQYGMRLYSGYGKALNEICRENGFSVLALGTEADKEITDSNLKDIKVKTVNLCGKTALGQTAAILKRVRLAVGAETGLAHISCAVGTPHVIVLGGGHFGRFMPYSPLTTIACLPLDCYGCNWVCKHERAVCVQDLNSEVLAGSIGAA